MKLRSLAPLLLALAACEGPPLIGWAAPTHETLVGEWELAERHRDHSPYTLLRFSETGEVAIIAREDSEFPGGVGRLSGDRLILAPPGVEAAPDASSDHTWVRVSLNGEWLKHMGNLTRCAISDADTVCALEEGQPWYYRRR